MDQPQLYLPESSKGACGRVGQYRRLQQHRKKNGPFKRKGIERWHRAVSTNLVKQNVLVPKDESSADSDKEFHESQQNQKKNCDEESEDCFGKDAVLQMEKQGATVQLDVVEAETEAITQGNTLLRARRTTKRLSVTSLPSGLQKVPYSSKKRSHFPALKKKKRGMENILRKSDLTVDDLIETVTDKSMKLLAQRHAELQQCEFLGDEILQSSKQFQRISKRTMRKYKLKNIRILIKITKTNIV
nr:putative uncharacterized protein C3orf49 [Neomonachus schauinslandi]